MARKRLGRKRGVNAQLILRFAGDATAPVGRWHWEGANFLDPRMRGGDKGVRRCV